MARLAVVGLGTMGHGMAANLLRAGHDVTVWNRSEGRATDLVALGAREASSLADAVADVEFVLYCLSDDAAVRAVTLGADALAAVVPSGAVVIDLSTISPEASAEVRAAFERRGAHFLDAPVFGSKGEAAAGGLWVVVGGDDETVGRARPVLEAISSSVHHLGGAGAGVRMKLVGNLIVASQLLALGESLSLAAKAGLDLDAVLGVLAVTDFRSPIFDGVGAAVRADDYSPSFALALMQKDARLIAAFARELDVPLDGLSVVARYIDDAVASGHGGENASALIKAVAARAGAQLAR
ncbi:NAD(P)-dependent oxidoreductase [Microcella alkalica]|uniref:NAD(P)-dependent oxidoreductase n=1 Tax=Microcella alkalica TaxID=355930 RepID=UPI00145CC0B1|nr:NAD(P)-dependent oxidoreductase [Microcella alkalica]